jgi:hypothetical protein
MVGAIRKHRFGNNDFCLFCGYACLEALTRVTRRWLEERGIPKERLQRLLEEHHALGVAYDPELLIILCLRCNSLGSVINRRRAGFSSGALSSTTTTIKTFVCTSIPAIFIASS